MRKAKVAESQTSYNGTYSIGKHFFYIQKDISMSVSKAAIENPAAFSKSYIKAYYLRACYVMFLFG